MQQYEVIYVECPKDEENDYTMTVAKHTDIRIQSIEGPVIVLTLNEYHELKNKNL